MNSSFSTINTNLQLAWDSTSLGLYKECPRKYELSIIQGWIPKKESVHLTFGLLYHAALEAYDHARARGEDYDAGVRFAVRTALKGSWDYQLNRPWNSDDKYKNRLTLIRTVVWYLDQFKDDSAKTLVLANGKPAVELSFRFEIGLNSETGEAFLLCGHLDRLAEFQDMLFIFDRKTSKNSIDGEYFAKFSPDNQMSTYDLAGQVVWGLNLQGICLDAAQILITGSRFKRGFTYRTPEHRTEWLRDTYHWIKDAEQSAKQGHWRMNDKSCGNYGGCAFRGICSLSPLVRESWLKSKFEKRTWDPLQVRGDI